MYYLEIALLVAGVVALAIGYRKNHRNLLLSAAIILFFAGALGSAVQGFADGLSDGFTQSGRT